MTNEVKLQELRLRLLAVLRERLTELEDDEARQSAWEKTNWELLEGDLCPRCNGPALRFKDGLCLPCGAELVKEADRKERLRQRLLRFARAHNARVDRYNRRPA